MAAKKDKMIPSEKERKRALKYATPAGTGRMWVTMGIGFIIFGIILLLIPIGLAISEASAQRYDPESIHTATLVFYLLGAFFGFCGCFCVIFGKLAVKAFAKILCKDEIPDGIGVLLYYNGENTCGIRKKIECKPRQLSEKTQKWLIMSVAKRLTKMSKA